MVQTNTIYERFAEVVEEQPQACAIKRERGCLTFAQLDALVARIAQRLPAEASYIGVVMDHGVWQVATMLAILKRGAAYVPAEPDFPEERIRFMFTECAVDCVVANTVYAPQLQDFTVLVAEDTASTSSDVIAEDMAAVSSGAASEPLSPAYVLYTSGTTGTPKGVVVENRNVCHYARAFENEFHAGPGDTMLQYSVCSFDIFVEEVFASLLNGAALAIPQPEERANLDVLMEFSEHYGVTMISGFPYLFADIAERDLLPASVRLVISGGDVLRQRFVAKLLPKAQVYNTYGPSETTVCCSYFHCNGADALPDGSFPVGKAVLGTQVRVLDADLQPVVPGVIGEICISGGGVARGYVDASKNAAFTMDPQGTRIYRSGDLGYELPDGNLAFVRRMDSQVMILGKRVEVNEVESVLNRCAGIKAGVVRASADDHGLAYLTAYVVPEPSGFSLAQVKREMARYLTPFMIPEFFVLLDTLPRNANGKPDPTRLPKVLKTSDY